MTNRHQYFKNDTIQAVAAVYSSDERFAEILEAAGFEACTHEDWLRARWLTWNDAAVLEVEGAELHKKKETVKR